MSTIHLSEQDMREAHARAYWAWAKDHPQTAIAHFHGGKPPAMLAAPANGQPKAARKAKPRKGRRRRSPGATTVAQHNAMMRRLYGKNWRP